MTVYLLGDLTVLLYRGYVSNCITAYLLGDLTVFCCTEVESVTV